MINSMAHISCNMRTCGLPDMYTLGPLVYISGKPPVPMLQLLHMYSFIIKCMHTLILIFGLTRLVSWNYFVRALVCVCVCVCPPPRALITSGVIWCDIGNVRLVKQVSLLFPAFNYFIWHLPLINRMDVAILTQHVVSACQRKPRWHGTSNKRTTGKTEHFNYKSEWVNT